MKRLNTRQIIWKTSVLATMLTISCFSHAEVILDGTFGPSVDLQGPDFAIKAQLGKQIGNNLFHSFEKFNLNPNEIAKFSGPNTIENVISRVTGGKASYINGGIQSLMPKADMYFLNPAGIVFGNNARLNVQGSFYASTADYLRLGIDGSFNATYPEQSLLKVAPPTAFGFLDNSPASISKQGGFLFVPPRKTLSFIGGDLILEDTQFRVGGKILNSFMGASDGQINLVSVASPGEVSVNPQKMPDDAFERFGRITITDTTPGIYNLDRKVANVDVSGTGGGEVYIRGGQIVMDNGYVWADTRGHKNGQGITIKASEELRLSKGSRITAQVVKKTNSSTDFTPTGNAGNITINAKRIFINDGSEIDSSSQVETAGAAGNVTVSAEESIEIAGFLLMPVNGETAEFKSGIHSQTAGSGKGGNITVATSSLIMRDNGVIRADTQNVGDAGNILVQVDTLTLAEGATIRTSSQPRPEQETIETGHGGKITINANKAILISGYERGQPSGLFSNAYTQGEGGAIEISAPNAFLEIREKGGIQSGAKGEGNAGTIIINVSNMALHQAAITTQSSQSACGDITIQTPNRLYFVNSKITTTASGDKKRANGGNITLSKPDFLILENSQLLTTGFVGDGGNIRAIAEQFIKSSDSLLDASSTLGVNGEITIDSSVEELNEINILPSNFRKITDLRPNHCDIRSVKEISSLKLGTRRGLSVSPDELQH